MNGDLFKEIAHQPKAGGFIWWPEQIYVRWKHHEQLYYKAKNKICTSGQHHGQRPFSGHLVESLESRRLFQVADRDVEIRFNPDDKQRIHAERATCTLPPPLPGKLCNTLA